MTSFGLKFVLENPQSCESGKPYADVTKRGGNFAITSSTQQLECRVGNLIINDILEMNVQESLGCKRLSSSDLSLSTFFPVITVAIHIV